jgi:hypothetical protein
MNPQTGGHPVHAPSTPPRAQLFVVFEEAAAAICIVFDGRPNCRPYEARELS